MDDARWRKFLERYSVELLADDELRNEVPDEAQRAGEAKLEEYCDHFQPRTRKPLLRGQLV